MFNVGENETLESHFLQHKLPKLLNFQHMNMNEVRHFSNMLSFWSPRS